MFIKALWTHPCDNTQEALTALVNYLGQYSYLPEYVYVVSAGEAHVLLDPEVLQAVVELDERGHHIQFVGSACTSFHAAVLAFQASDQVDALVINLELNKPHQQACLDSLGIGTAQGQDGLNVRTGVAATWLTRRYDEDAIAKIVRCDILSQAPGLNGTHELVRKMYRMVKKEQAQVVSFDIQSRWAKALMKAWPNGETEHWLPSIEGDGDHVLSLKPLLEIERYFKASNDQVHFLFTLGGGGRVGSLAVVNIDSERQLLPRVVHHERLPLHDALNNFMQAHDQKDNLETPFLSWIRSAMTYPDKQYRGRHNQIFHWYMEPRNWKSLLTSLGESHG